jgi:hypothetical protein
MDGMAEEGRSKRREASVMSRVVTLVIGLCLLASAALLRVYFWGLLVHWLEIFFLCVGLLLVVASVVGLASRRRVPKDEHAAAQPVAPAPGSP